MHQKKCTPEKRDALISVKNNFWKVLGRTAKNNILKYTCQIACIGKNLKLSCN